MIRRRLTSDAAPPAAMAGADAPHSRWRMRGPAVKVAIAGNIVLVVLVFAVIVWRLFFAGEGNNNQEGAGAVSPPQEADGGVTAITASSSGASTPSASPRTRGLRKEDLLALPVFVIVEQDAFGDDQAESGVVRKLVECAVCISELNNGDTGRLLPRCGHRFHAECVDRWFRSNITCPLCRAVVADGSSSKQHSKATSVVV